MVGAILRSVALIAIFLVCMSGCSIDQVEPQGVSVVSTVTIADQTLSVTKVTKPAELAKGLAGVSSLAWNEGMLFVFEDRAVRTFWMKDMRMPIDIIWIDEGLVVGFAQNVPPPDPQTSDQSLSIYTSPQPVTHVLEVAAGFAEKFGVSVGDEVVVSK